MVIRIIGDIHGKIDKYGDLLKCESSIQIGDIGFKKQWEKLIRSPYFRKKFETGRHKIIPGNHDFYPLIDNKDIRTFSNDFGYETNFCKEFLFFYVKGALSIDKDWRIFGIDWFEEEELSYKQSLNCVESYQKHKPEVIISHDCPTILLEVMFNKYDIHSSLTGMLLNNMFNFNRPKLWIFGHHHITKAKYINNTLFVCLGELDYIEYNTARDLDTNIIEIREQCQ